MNDCRFGYLDVYHMERYCHEHGGFAQEWNLPRWRCDRAPKPQPFQPTGEPQTGGEQRG